ncbi:hypothetical protein HIM_11037 [Hirsutella minnesotensis 3608]|uniref:HAT C-terminal dimerisation domain-containing protein n=1 Tax=Hirsutella minnesotensis 3608 TaxID=1043627 RepID=A0A0F7ZJE1_9HYPO|nr:hypothetical protein HIM_11037 [Hirsutella minnesotensis 3608]
MSNTSSHISDESNGSAVSTFSNIELHTPGSSAVRNAVGVRDQRKRKRKTTANTWIHAREPRNSEPARCSRKNEKIYYCMHCTDPAYSTTVSTTFRNHLLKNHGIDLQADDHPIKKQRNTLIQDAVAKAGEMSAAKRSIEQEETLQAAVNRKAAIEALVQLVTVRNLSYNCCSWPELHAFVCAINHTADDLISLSHGSIQKLVSNSYHVHKDILRRKLQSSPSKLHLSADVWSAPNHKGFLGTCVKFVDPDSKDTLQALLALSELPGLDGPGSHGGDEQWKLLQNVLEDYNIWSKVGFYTGDNHGSNDKLCRLLSGHLQEKGIHWAFLFIEPKEAAQAALEHIEGDDEIGLAADFATKVKAQKALGWRRLGPLGKVHNIAVHMRENDYRWNLFRRRAGRSLVLDNDTRWNSWFRLLDVTLDLQEHVEWYQKKYYDDLQKDYLTPEEWRILEETRAFLQPFWKITQLTEGRYATLDRTLFTMDVLHKHYTQSFQKYLERHPLRSCIAASWAVFDKYYRLTDESLAYGAATILHPSRRMAHIQKHWPKSWHKPVLDNVERCCEEYYQVLPISTITPELRNQSHQLDEYDLLARELDVVSPAMNEIDEYKSFTTQTPVPIDCSPLTWWLREEQQQRYPRLSKMAIDILSIPAMSAEPERVFSGARRTISWDRCLLGSRTIEKGECMKSWIKSGITRGIPVDIVVGETDHW